MTARDGITFTERLVHARLQAEPFMDYLISSVLYPYEVTIIAFPNSQVRKLRHEAWLQHTGKRGDNLSVRSPTLPLN